MVKMPQRQRHNTGGGTGGAELPLLDPGVIEGHNAVTARCCIPLTTNCLRGYEPINTTSPVGCVRVLCNNENCRMGNYMHKECFNAWETHVLVYLKSCGRARSWSEKIRLQNLWTKRGYDLAYKACSCLCGRGHLRKDLDWMSPEPEEDTTKKTKKKKNRQNNKPALVTIGVPLPVTQRNRNNSLSSGSSPPSDTSSSPSHMPNNVVSRFERDRRGSGGSIVGGKVMSSTGGILGNTGMFARRPNFCSFNDLPPYKLNSYHIKLEDDSNHGNDEIRGFVLATLAALRASKVNCVLCHQSLLVFDRYPLIDGTFFLTPVQHSKSALLVPEEMQLPGMDGGAQYLAAVCLGCIWGKTSEVRCNSCSMKWTGSKLILGCMYQFDIFAATPCCVDRLRCSRCECVAISPDQKLNYFSEYTRLRACSNCGLVDYHFVKKLSSAFSIVRDCGRL